MTNFLMIVTDDEDAFADPSYMPNLVTYIKNEGINFTLCFDEFSLCSPSRTTLLTGLISHNHGVTGNGGVTGGWNGLKVYTQNTPFTLPKWLQLQGGYYTAHVGKLTNGFEFWDFDSPTPNWAGPLQIPVGWDYFSTIIGNTAELTASISNNGMSNTLHVTNVASGTIVVGNYVFNAGITTDGLVITGPSGQHGNGDYALSGAPVTVASSAFTLRGFDVTTYFNFRLNVNGVEMLYSGDDDLTNYTTDIFSQQVLDVIANIPAGTPWYVEYWPNSPHAPADPSPEFAGDFNSVPMPIRGDFNEAAATFDLKPGWTRFDPENEATFTASTAGTTMTVTSVPTGDDGSYAYAVANDAVLDATGIADGTTVVEQTGGTTGGIGTYTISVSQTLASRTFTQPQPRKLVNRHNQEDSWRRRRECMLSIDKYIPLFIAAIQARGELDDTVIMYLSDNGKVLGEHRLVGKDCPYEEGTRVPMAWRGPGIEAGSISAKLTSNLDVVATVCDIAGITAPALPIVPGGTSTGDGHTLQDLFDDPNSSSWRTALPISCIPNTGYEANGVRSASAWYCEWTSDFYGDEVEYYLVSTDPYELQRREALAAYAATVAAHQAALEDLITVTPCKEGSCFFTTPLPGPTQRVTLRTGNERGFARLDVSPGS